MIILNKEIDNIFRELKFNKIRKFRRWNIKK